VVDPGLEPGETGWWLISFAPVPPTRPPSLRYSGHPHPSGEGLRYYLSMKGSRCGRGRAPVKA